MACILAATDFSGRSDRAVRRAGMLAGEIAAELVLTHVVDDDQPRRLVEAQRREATALLAEQIGALAELKGVACRLHLAESEAFDGIVQAADATDADLIVMGAHRKRLLRDVFTGTTVERVMRTGSRPVLMVHREPQAPYHRLLAAIDLAEPSARALETARELGLTAGRHLTLLHAFDPAPAGMLTATGAASADQVELYLKEASVEAAAALGRFLDQVELGHADLDLRVEPGPAVGAILDHAEGDGSELLILGTRARSGLARAFLGSVAAEVLRTTDRDALVVPWQAPGAA